MEKNCKAVVISHLTEDCWYFKVVETKEVKEKGVCTEKEVKREIHHTIPLEGLDCILNVDVDKKGKLYGIEVIL